MCDHEYVYYVIVIQSFDMLSDNFFWWSVGLREYEITDKDFFYKKKKDQSKQNLCK